MKNKFLLIVLIILSLLPTLDLVHKGLPITHDGQDHVARIANFYASLSEGNIVPRWAANLNWGYGHPILMFLYPLPSYIASLFHFLGFTFVDSTKLVFAVSFIASMLFMYLWLKSQWGGVAGFVGAVLYGFAPYRFIDFTVRGAIGEHIAFVFPPIIFLSLFLLTKKTKKSSIVSVLAISTAGLILAHNAISLMFFPLIGLYITYLILAEVPKRERLRFISLSIWGTVLGFLLSAFFWIPAYFEGKYTLRDIVTKGDFTGRFVPWSSFIYSPWNYGIGEQFSKELGFAQIFVVLWSLFLLKKSRERWLIVGSLFILILTLFMMTNASGWVWSHITILQKFQFPWRFLSVTTFLSALLGAIAISRAPKKHVWVLGIFVAALSIVLTIPMWKAKAYSVKPESFYTDIYAGTTDTGESSPIWSVRFMEHKPPVAIQGIEGLSQFYIGKRTTTRREYTVRVIQSARLVENTLYFPGWRVFVDGNPVPIEFQDPNYRGLMTFRVSPGEHQIVVSFGNTKVRTMANIVSLISLFLLGGTAAMLDYGNYHGKRIILY